MAGALALATKAVGLLFGSLKPIAAMGGGLAVPITISVIGGEILSKIVYSMIPGLEAADKKAFKITIDIVGSLYDFLIGNAVDAVGDLGAEIGGKLADALRNTFGDKLGSLSDELSKVDWGDWDDIAPTIEPKLDLTKLEDDLNKIDWADWVESTNEALVVTPSVAKDKFLDDLETALNKENWEDWDDPKMTIGVDVPEKEIEKAKEKLAKYLGGTGAVEPITVSAKFDFEDFSAQFNTQMENIQIPDFDLGGLSELIGSLDTLKSSIAKGFATEAIEAQIRLMEASADKMEASGQAIKAGAYQMFQASQVMWQTSTVAKTINIAMAGVEPEIELILWKILKRIQVRANESGAEFLLAAAD